MRMSEDTLVQDEIVTKSGRVFKSYHKDLLKNIPAEIVEEMARRELEKIESKKQ
jgi:activator of HSP90 ATPase